MVVESCAFGWEHVNWGSIPDWLAAVGTIGAFGVAASAWRIQARDRAAAAQADREERARTRRAQARQLIMKAEVGSGYWEDQGTPAARVEWDVNVEAYNTSGSTFTDVGITARVATQTGAFKAHDEWAILPFTGDGSPFQFKLKAIMSTTSANAEKPEVSSLEWWVTDSAGVRWHMPADRRLEEVTESS